MSTGRLIGDAVVRAQILKSVLHTTAQCLLPTGGLVQELPKPDDQARHIGLGTIVCISITAPRRCCVVYGKCLERPTLIAVGCGVCVGNRARAKADVPFYRRCHCV
jgi:hypothetical protein